MDEIHVHKIKKSICAHFAESPCTSAQLTTTTQPSTSTQPSSSHSMQTSSVDNTLSARQQRC